MMSNGAATKSVRIIITPWRVIAGLILLIGLISALWRFISGLGATTNLTNEVPWGLWIGFDILFGIGLAAGGFTVTAIVYLFGNKTLKPIARPAILTAFLGYLLFIAGLICDIGRWWNLPQPAIPWHWNFRSVLFEVAMCVMTYTTVLFLEFLGPVFEKFKWKTLQKIQHTFLIPLVILGVLLSLMHQSSLGSLFVIFPQKMHPLWYSMIQPVIFFVSCITAGIAMTIFENYCSHRFLKRSLHKPQLIFLTRLLVVFIILTLVTRVIDLTYRGAWSWAFVGGDFAWETFNFWLEIVLCFILPLILLSRPKIRTNQAGRFIAALLFILGFLMHRMNVAITSLGASARQLGAENTYYPAFPELMITVSLVALGFVAFWALSSFFPIFPKEEEETPKDAGGEPDSAYVKIPM